MSIVGPTGGYSILGTRRSQASSGFRQLVAGGTSTFGPAFLLGGSAANAAQGLYNQLGQLLAAGQSAFGAGPRTPSHTQQKRAEALDRAATKIDFGDPAGGRADALQLIEQNGRDVTAIRLVAHSYLAEQKYKQAEQYYARALALAPNSNLLKGELANARDLQKDDDQVLGAARRQLKNGATRTQGLRLLLHLTDRSPNNVDAYLALADDFAAHREPLEVIGALQEAVRVADDSNIEAVISRAQALVDSNGDVGLTHNILGRALEKAGHLDRAIAELEIGADIAPSNFSYRRDQASGYVTRALQRLASRDVASAEADLAVARSIDPGNFRLREADARVALERGQRYLDAGLNNRALGKLNTAAAKAPNDVAFKKRLSVLYLRLGARYLNDEINAQALNTFIKAYELDPTSAAARRKVGQLSYSEGMDALEREDYDGAITQLERAHKTYRANVTYRQDLARAYDERGLYRLSLGQDDKALEDFKRGFELDPTNASLDANLSAALLAQ
ncbi:MAG: hypothetical protein IID40_04105 [Planctomycetes bacterium]|nr:hypothetical protein [Planctomycetota bacterium]